MDRMCINILGLSEVHWRNSGKITSKYHTVIYSGGQHHERGVGVILDKEHTITGVALEPQQRCADSFREIQVPTTLEMVADIFHELPFTVSLNLKTF